METINFSGLTKEDLLKAKPKIETISCSGHVRVSLFSNAIGVYLRNYLSSTRSGDHIHSNLTVLFYFDDRFEIRVEYSAPHEDDITPVLTIGPLKKFPTTISGIGMRKSKSKKIIWAYNWVKDNFGTLDDFHEKLIDILKALKAPSKEEFYDDASDYQDDEPTDFGDASNYDEGLVRRIKECLE